MDMLIWAGAAVTLLGVAGLVWCVMSVAKARRAGLTDDQLKVRLQRVIALNLAALMVSALGLMMVILGIFLG